MNEKQISKIRKLLALSQSDNPHEAAIAHRQAESLMRKFAIGRDDLEIETKRCKVIERKAIKLYEAYLVNAIEQVSGCFGVFKKSTYYMGGRVHWRNHLDFTGLAGQVDIATYSFDVLRLQVETAINEYRNEFGEGWREGDIFGEAWMLTAVGKLKNVFGTRQLPPAVKAKHDELLNSDSIKSTASKETNEKYVSDSEFCKLIGSQRGNEAVLNQATNDQREVQLKLERD